ncbi:uncharacterized protein LOC130778715 [Actinidia eriantha]|uniref:uncharacterized protein LOC130778715 n=1 Tax=Actinidia eriantha TaxID=165200 RepID=UPI002583B01D|nr:uncharacterized protein LOC130778715 [Actinidia eriantha]
MDCTYKTNGYRLPLIEIVGVTSIDLTLSAAIAYLQFERANNYTWALDMLRILMDESTLHLVILTYRELVLMNGIGRVIPEARDLLCGWHINKNVMAKCKRAESSHAKLKRQFVSSQGSFESSWTRIHSLLELQHTDIKAFFEKSLTIIQHNFKPFEFKELRGNVSIMALDKVLMEMKRVNNVGIDVSARGCVIQRTQGECLPCAHKIAEYMRKGRPIPISCTLNYLRKLREIVGPYYTFLIETYVKPNPKPRGHRKIDISTRRDPCAFELIQPGRDSYSPKATQQTTRDSAPAVKQQRHSKEKVNWKRSQNACLYNNQFRDALRPYIQLVKDVAVDGTCGFRAVAGLIALIEEDFGPFLF